MEEEKIQFQKKDSSLLNILDLILSYPTQYYLLKILNHDILLNNHQVHEIAQNKI